MALQMEQGHQYFTENCKKNTAHATFTDDVILSVFTVDITDGYIPSVCYREF